MKRVKLANIVTEVDDFLRGHETLFYRLGEASWAEQRCDNEGAGVFCFTGTVDFSTYFNSLSLSKWRQYCDIRSARLHLSLRGDACAACIKVVKPRGDSFAIVEIKRAQFDPSFEFSRCEVDLPINEGIILGFELMSDGVVELQNGYYYTLVDEASIRPVRLALCTTTFHKEDYLIPNIERIKASILRGDDEIAQAFHMYVIDNGQTLDVEALSDQGVTICPNPNVGGSGGFARGMIEALDADEPFSHVILMDDDVRIAPESLKRSFTLLSLVKAEYANAFLNGAMLEIDRPELQYEDVSFVRSTGGYEKIKPDLFMDRTFDLARNESIDVEVERAYGAWWYCCMPLSAIREHGLPLPFFVRCDDVEYGLRCAAPYMTMNGIGLWHERFEGRFRAAVDCYQYARNMLITIAMDRCSQESIFMWRFWRVFRIYLRFMNYGAAELWLKGLDDYLKGPDFIASVDGAALMKENSALNEKLSPVEELDGELWQSVIRKKSWLSGRDTRSTFRKLLETIPHDRHWFPDWLLRNRPVAVGVSGSLTPWYLSALRSCLIALDEKGEHGHMRRMDRARYRSIVAYARELHDAYRNNCMAVAESYQDAFRRLSSVEFWRGYLGLEIED